EGAPAAIAALQAENPLASAMDRFAEVRLAAHQTATGKPIHRHHHRRCIVEIRIMWIRVLKRPPARTHVRRLLCPTADRSEYLPFLEPRQTAAHRGTPLRSPRTGGLQQRVTREHRVPDRRHARLAIRFLAVHDEQAVDRPARPDTIGMVARTAKRIEHHDCVRHGREDRAQAVFAIETFSDKTDGFRDRTAANRPRNPALCETQRGVYCSEKEESRARRMRCTPPAARARVMLW